MIPDSRGWCILGAELPLHADRTAYDDRVMTLTIGDRPLHRLSVADLSKMIAAGILGEDDRVELLQGALVDMSPKSAEHTAVLTILTRWLAPLVVLGAHDVRIEQPLAVPDPGSLPEPDLAVVTRSDELLHHPTSALLVVEVAVSSHATDTTVKAALYAAAGVIDYWVVDVARRRLEVRRDPVRAEFRRLGILGPEDRAAPLGLDVQPLELAALFG